MSLVVGIRFREVGKLYYFDSNGVDLFKDDFCLVETSRGKEIGQVVLPERDIASEKITNPLKKILRKASEEDIEKLSENQRLEKKAFDACYKKIKDREMAMKLIKVEYAFDASKITFFFSAEGRIDFRELVKDLAHVFKTRIELRQIGVRDEAKKHGGYGTCGREFCCSSWLPAFVPVSIRMAKEQNLVLNPTKISGICGRLMCCLMYEYETYSAKRKLLPKMGSRINTPQGLGRVRRLDILQEKVWVQLEEGKEACFCNEELKGCTPVQAGQPSTPDKKDSDNSQNNNNNQKNRSNRNHRNNNRNRTNRNRRK